MDGIEVRVNSSPTRRACSKISVYHFLREPIPICGEYHIEQSQINQRRHFIAYRRFCGRSLKIKDKIPRVGFVLVLFAVAKTVAGLDGDVVGIVQHPFQQNACQGLCQPQKGGLRLA